MSEDKENELKEQETDPIVTKLLAAGGQIWDKRGRRIYISKIWKNLFDVEITYHMRGSGISSFHLNGDLWSNRQANRLISCFNVAYYDLDKKKWCNMEDYNWVFNDFYKKQENNEE